MINRVWGIFLVGLDAARGALLAEKPWNWKDAWRVLREKLGETRRAAVEGAEAIRLESTLYAASFGKPGLVALQYFIDHMTPKFFSASLEESLKHALATVENDNVREVELAEFSVGGKAPELLDACAYDLDGEDALAFDVDMKWDSELEAKLMVKTSRISMTVPISVQNVRFKGVVRFVLAPLTPDPPGFGAALVSLPTAPSLELEVRMAGGEITKMPWLRTEIMSTIQTALNNEFLWPRRAVIPSAAKPHEPPETMLSESELEELSVSDPLLRAELDLAKKPAYQENLEKVHTAKDRESSVKMGILLKEENCEDEDECIVDYWSYSSNAKPGEGNVPLALQIDKSVVGFQQHAHDNYIKLGSAWNHSLSALRSTLPSVEIIRKNLPLYRLNDDEGTSSADL